MSPLPIRFCNGMWGFREMPFADFCRASAQLGCEYVEVYIARPPRTGHLAIDATDGDIARVKNEAAAAGVEIACAVISNDFTVVDSDELRDQLTTAKQRANVAARIGAEVLRVFAGVTPFESLNTRIYEQCGRTLRELGEYCAPLGVLVAVENHGGITATAAQVRRLLVIADHPNVKANYDAGNFARAREDPLSAWMALEPYVGYMHFKDVRSIDAELHYCALGDGITDWAPVVRAIQRSGYHGYWTIEYEEPQDCVEGTRKCLDVIRAASRLVVPA